jgi:S-adenosylmethionine/arginine decarboxylase-like enzyme
VRQRGSSGAAAILFLDTDGCHFAAHAFPERGVLLLDVLVPSGRDAEKAVEVFVRKLAAKTVRRHIMDRA